LTPDGTPVLLLAAGYIRELRPSQASVALPFLRSTLAQLRGGKWWLDYQERKLYDAELCTLISTSAGSAPVEDSRFVRIGAIERAIRRAAPFRRDSPSRLTTGEGDAPVLLLVSPESGESAGWRGTAISGPDLSAFTQDALGPIHKTFSFPLALADSAGHTFWSNVSGRIARRLPLRAVPGWQLLAGEPPAESGRLQRGLWYGFLGLLLAMLVFGLAMTDRLVRREVELARLQAEFAASVTHEFKSPLTGLRLLMERIGSGRLVSQESFREYLSAMRRETDRLDHLVNRLLETHRIQSGQKRYQIAPHCITDIAQTAVARLRTQAEAKKITVTVDSDDPTREIDVDRTALQDSFENLLENAIKYSPSGTSVALTIRHGHRDLLVSVRDEGLGIDPADLPRIFDRFYRGRRIPGTGLGLALVKAVAEGHGGAVEVESALGGGSEFRLRIPIREEETYVAGPNRG
jgi:signal transduction histidine kinase